MFRLRLPWASRSESSGRSRGQAMVEFALILPLLVLLLVMAVDFGRVFFGSIGLYNAARIAANAAASDPEPWSPPTITSGQNAYRRLVLNELVALNCQPTAADDTDGDGAWDLNEIPDPVFVSQPTGFSSDPYEVGDHAVASLDCAFSLITPLAEIIVGGPVAVGAEAQFMVRGGEINGVPIGPAPPPPACVDKVVPNLIGQTVAAARTAWTAAGFTGTFDPAVGSDTDIVTAQTTTPSSSPGGCLVETATVSVTHSSPGPCTSPETQVPSLIGLTVAQARSTWTANGFTGSFSPASGSDSNIVSAQTTSPTSSPGDCLDPSASVTVTHAAPPPPQCTMPDLLGKKVNSGDDIFYDEGHFTGSYTITRPPQGNYDITSQSLVAGQLYDCTSSVIVAGN